MKLHPDPREPIYTYDTLILLGREERVCQMESMGLVIQRARSDYTEELMDPAMPPTEMIIAPRASVIGQTLKELQFRSKYGLTAIALWRGTRSYRTDVGIMPLQAGDALFVVGPLARIQMLAREPDYIFPHGPPAPMPDTRRGIWAALIAVLVIGLAAFHWIAAPEAMLAGAVALVLTGCIRIPEVYRAIEWRILVLIAAMVPLGIAMQTTGLAAHIGQVFTTLLLPFGALALIAGMYLFTVLITQVIGGQVAALVVGPLAITVALQAQVNPTAMAVAVSMACSVSFLTPIAHPVNLLMLTPGGYTAQDFLRIGSGMTVVCFITLLVVMPLFWQLTLP